MTFDQYNETFKFNLLKRSMYNKTSEKTEK